MFNHTAKLLLLQANADRIRAASESYFEWLCLSIIAILAFFKV